VKQSKLAARRAALINLLWEFKRKVEIKESLDFMALLSDPVYRCAALERYRYSRSTTLQAMLGRIQDLDPRTDLSETDSVALFAETPQKNHKGGTSNQQRITVGAGLMLIGVVALLGIATFRLLSVNSHVVAHRPGETAMQHDAAPDLSLHESRQHLLSTN